MMVVLTDKSRQLSGQGPARLAHSFAMITFPASSPPREVGRMPAPEKSRSMNMAKAMARHILVKTEAEAEQLKKRLANGEAFDVLARKHSTCPSAKRGGDLGEVRPGQMVRAIDQVIFKKPVRIVHGPVKSQFGYHLVQVFYRD